MSQEQARQAGILVWGKTLAMISESIVPLVVVRLLGKSDVGVFSGLIVVYATLSLILTAGFPDSLSYYLPGRSLEERRAVAWKVTGITALMGVVCSAMLVALPILQWVSPPLAEELFSLLGGTGNVRESLQYLVYFAPYPLVDMPIRILPNLLVIENRAESAASVGIVKALGSSLSVVIPLALGAGIGATVISITAFGIAYGGYLIYFLHDIYRGAPKVVAKGVTWRELVWFSVPLGITDVVGKVNSQVDRYLVLARFSLERFAEYHIGAWQIPMVNVIAYTVGATNAPRLAELFKAGRSREAIELFRVSAVKVALIVVPITMVFIVAAEETLSLLFTSEYVVGAQIFRLYSIFTLARITSFGSVIVAAGRPAYVLQAAVVMFVSNLVLSVPLLLWLGFTGPAWGTVIAWIPSAAFYSWSIARAAQVPFGSVYPLLAHLRVIAVAALAAVPAILFKVLVPTHPAIGLLVIAILVLGCFAGLGTLLRLISRRDWQFMADWLRFRMSRGQVEVKEGG